MSAIPDIADHFSVGTFITEFQHRLDRALSMDDLVDENVVISTPEREVRGRAAFSAGVQARGGDKAVRHCWHNLRIERDGRDDVTARYIAIALHGPGDSLLNLITVGDVTDRLRWTAGSWRLVSSRFDRVFRHEPRIRGEV